MDCIFEIELKPSDWIAIVAAIIALVSATWSWSEAKRANSINLLGPKKEIYDAFLDLRIHMTQCAASADLGEVSKFHYYHRDAKVYLPKELAEQILEYYILCQKIITQNLRNKGGFTDEIGTLLNQEISLGSEIEGKFRDLLKVAKSA